MICPTPCPARPIIPRAWVAARAAKEDVRAVVAKAAPLLREIWEIRVESRQAVQDRCHRATPAPSWCRQRRCPRLPDVLDLQNNLRTLMMKCDMSDISFILEIQCADEVRLRFSASDWSLRRTCAVFKEFVLVGVTSSASFVRKRMLGSRTV